MASEELGATSELRSGRRRASERAVMFMGDGRALWQPACQETWPGPYGL
jgi:hypothetical protein